MNTEQKEQNQLLLPLDIILDIQEACRAITEDIDELVGACHILSLDVLSRAMHENSVQILVPNMVTTTSQERTKRRRNSVRLGDQQQLINEQQENKTGIMDEEHT